MIKNKEFDVLDALSVISFIVGWFNYYENVDQSTMQNTVQEAVHSIQEHLNLQDKKIDKILESLGGKENER